MNINISPNKVSVQSLNVYNYFHTICFCLFMLLSISATAQKGAKIEGIIEDTLSNPLIHATVLLLEESDSTMVEFTRSELDGSFKFKDIESGNYLVKTTYLGYIPLHVPASTVNGNVDLGLLKMEEMATELMEVVIKAAKAQIKMRGDTIEYDATTFKVPEGSSVEELLKRLPGMEVELDGTILSDGKTVSEVTVDGKSFFGSNPKAATENLPAESISKVQVFDKKNEEEEITGSTSESQDKTMNLELKEDYKSGGFGRLIAGVGTEERAELKGNFNRFNEKIQFSLVGVGNNTGRNGLSWDDYQDFMGSQSFNFDDNGDYGFGGGGGKYFSFGGSGGGLESSIQNLFFSGGNSGLPENYNGGINFNYDHKKTKLSSVYYYNQAGLLAESSGFQDRFFQDFQQQGVSNNVRDNLSQGHRVELQLEQELDSLHTIKVKVNGAILDQNNLSSGSSTLSRNDVLTNASEYNNDDKTDGQLFNSIVFFRKKFKKKGRSMGLNASYLYTDLNDISVQQSLTSFFATPGSAEFEESLNQNNINLATKNHIKANALFVEPLSKRFFWQAFYNFSNRREEGLRDVSDLEGGRSLTNIELSRLFTNNINANRLGSSLRYSHNGYNISAGLAYQAFELGGDYNSEGGTFNGVVDETFINIIPNLSINFSPVRNAYVDISFTRFATEPRIDDLQPIVDISNPLYVRVGNPDLTPEVVNSISGYVSRSYPASGVRFNFNGSFDFYNNRFSQSETVDENLKTTYQPINLEGGFNSNFWTSINVPIIKGKFTSRASLFASFEERPTLVNNFENNTSTARYEPSFRFNITPVDDVALYLTARFSNANTTYDINTSQDQKVTSTNLSAEFNTKLAFGFYLNSNFNYRKYQNDRFDANEEIPILNASVYRQFLPGKKAELRLAIYDAFNENRGFFQGASGNGISQSTTVTLGRYVMLSLTYNIKGLKSGVKKDGWW